MSAGDTAKTVFTTGEAAKVCLVSQQTIIRCFDDGSLKGFRVPGSRFRRIPRDCLYAFMKDNGIPTDSLEPEAIVLLIEADDQRARGLESELDKRAHIGFPTQTSAFDGGFMVREIVPPVVVINTSLPDIDGAMACKSIRQRPKLRNTKIVALSADPGREQDALAEAGADLVLSTFIPAHNLLPRLAELLEIRLDLEGE